MDIGKSFSYVFEDPRWVSKVAIGGAILLVGWLFFWVLLIPLLAAYILVGGYALTVVKNVSEGNADPLPEWNDFGGFFMKGLYAGVGALVLYIPVLILFCCILALGAVSGGSQQSNGNSATAFLALCFNCLSALFSLVYALYIYAPMTRYALNGQLSTFWDFGGNLAFIQSNLSGYIIALIMTFIAGFIGGLGFILCAIPGFFTSFWASLVGAHIFGQFARGAPAQMSMTPMTPPMAPTAPIG